MSCRICNVIIVFCVVILASVARCFASEYKNLEKMSAEDLVLEGQRKVDEGNYEGALVFFTVASMRYDKNMPKEDVVQVLKSNVGKWYIYFFAYFDYVNAYKSLSMAQEIADKIGYDKARIMLDFGCMYQTLSEQSDDEDLLKKSYDYYVNSFNMAERENDCNTLNMAFSNMLQLSVQLDTMSEMGQFMQRLCVVNEKNGHESQTFTFDKLFYAGMLKVQNKDWAGALDVFNSPEMKAAVCSKGMERYAMIRCFICSQIYCNFPGKRDDALNELKRAEAIADSAGFRDARVEVYRKLADFYKTVGKEDHAIDYQHRFFALKDSMLNYRVGAAIGEFTYLKKVEQVEQDIEVMKHRRTIQNRVIAVGVCVIIAILLFLFFLKRKNMKLKSLNETLYKKNKLLLEQEESARKAQAAVSEEGILIEAERNAVKYMRSDLNDEEKEQIFRSIETAIRSTDEVYSPDFSVNRLSELTGYTYRHISQVINEKTGDNFNTYINECRIKEACRRIQHQSGYTSLTVEAIANSVGFRARSSFIAAFKKFTGMTPSQYLKIARETSGV